MFQTFRTLWSQIFLRRFDVTMFSTCRPRRGNATQTLAFFFFFGRSMLSSFVRGHSAQIFHRYILGCFESCIFLWTTAGIAVHFSGRFFGMILSHNFFVVIGGNAARFFHEYFLGDLALLDFLVENKMKCCPISGRNLGMILFIAPFLG